MSQSYFPPGETEADLFLERSNLNGLILSGVFYGILFTLFVQCVQLLFQNQSKREKRPWVSIIYTCFLFVLATIGFAGNTKFNQMTYIDLRNYPGGPNAVTVDFYSCWQNMMSFICYVILGWGADGLVLFRFLLIWNFNYWMLPIPAMLYLGSISMSMALFVAILRPGGTFWTAAAIKFGIAYWSLSMSLNIILTALIAGRLLTMRSRIISVLGREHGRMYTSVTAMLVESAALYSILGIIFIISYARGSAFQNIVLPPFGQAQAIAPLLIILRVAQGRAWNRDQMTATTRGVLSARPSGSRVPGTSFMANGVALSDISSKINIGNSSGKVTVVSSNGLDSEWNNFKSGHE